MDTHPTRRFPMPARAMLDELLDVLDRHGYGPVATTPNFAVGWALAELDAFLTAYRDAPARVEG